MGTEKSAFDRSMMRFALRAARRGRPSPNPHVGAVIVQGRQVIAVGHHERAGEAHAEVAALRRAAERARGATLYVTLEPCNHHGRTGPCTEAIVAAGIARVVVGCRDPKPHVPGALERLSAAGIEITVPLCASEAESTIADFAKHFVTGMPYVTLLAGLRGEHELDPNAAACGRALDPALQRRLERLRRASDAVLIDRDAARRAHDLRSLPVVLDAELALADDAAVIASLRRARGLIFHSQLASDSRIAALRAAGVELQAVRAHDGNLDLDAVLRELGRRDVVRLLVECGPTLEHALSDLGQLDRAVLWLEPSGASRASPADNAWRAERAAAHFGFSRCALIERGRDLLLEGELQSRLGVH